VLFDRSTFEESRALTGDRGARAVVDRDPQRVAFLELDTAKPFDIDRPEDLARLVRQRQYISSSTSQRP
jgi:molybdenum cofactor cytidylyltransferase